MTGQHILIVEDEVKIMNVLHDYVENAGFRVSELKRGEKVIPFINTHPVDLILLDVMLPGMDGIEICREIRKFSDIPIIMITSRVSDNHKARAIELGVNDYLGKPYQEDVLLEAVRQLLDKELVRDSN